MKDTVSIPLSDSSRIQEMIDFFQTSKLTKKMKISQNSDDHPYSFNYPDGLYISFGYLSLSQDYFLFSFVKMVASLFGYEKVNPKDGQLCKYYKYNAENFLLVDLRGVNEPVEKIIVYENKIISKVEATELFDTIVKDENSKKVELIKLINKDLKDPRDSETNFFATFILHYFTEQKELISIYQSINDLKETK
jgi:hypothetical protein